MCYVVTRNGARQLVSQKTILVIGKIVNMPSLHVSDYDVISDRENSKKQVRIHDSLAIAKQLTFSEWLDVNIKAMEGTFKSIPERSELPAEINEQLVVELYSK